MHKPKTYSILFLLILLFSNVGLAFNIHYCQGQIEKISSVYSHHKHNDVCEMQQQAEKSCCNKTTISSQKDDDCCKDDILTQNPIDKNFVKVFPIQLDPFISTEIWNSENYDWIPILKKADSSPAFYCDSNAPPLFKLYCRLIFYA